MKKYINLSVRLELENGDQIQDKIAINYKRLNLKTILDLRHQIRINYSLSTHEKLEIRTDKGFLIDDMEEISDFSDNILNVSFKPEKKFKSENEGSLGKRVTPSMGKSLNYTNCIFFDGIQQCEGMLELMMNFRNLPQSERGRKNYNIDEDYDSSWSCSRKKLKSEDSEIKPVVEKKYKTRMQEEKVDNKITSTNVLKVVKGANFRKVKPKLQNADKKMIIECSDSTPSSDEENSSSSSSSDSEEDIKIVTFKKGKNLNVKKKKVMTPKNSVEESSDSSSTDEDSSEDDSLLPVEKKMGKKPPVNKSQTQSTRILETKKVVNDSNLKKPFVKSKNTQLISLNLDKLDNNSSKKNQVKRKNIEYIDLNLEEVKKLKTEERNSIFTLEGEFRVIDIKVKLLEFDELLMKPVVLKGFRMGKLLGFEGDLARLKYLTEEGDLIEVDDEVHLDNVFTIKISCKGLEGEIKKRIEKLSGEGTKPTFKDELTMASINKFKEKNKKIEEIDNTMTEDEIAISHQAAFYFGDKNYFRDFYIMNTCKKNENNAMPIRNLIAFNRIKNISDDFDFIYTALKKFENSPMCTYELIHDSKMIKKKGLTSEKTN